jgi:hypothetical protein
MGTLQTDYLKAEVDTSELLMNSFVTEGPRGFPQL